MYVARRAVASRWTVVPLPGLLSPWPTTEAATLAGSTCRGRLANSQQEAGPQSYNAGTERCPQLEPEPVRPSAAPDKTMAA